MSTDTSLQSPLAQELIRKAEAMAPALAERTRLAAEQRKVPEDTIRDFQEAGFFKVLQPKIWGGYELDPQVFYAIQLKIAEVCMSSAWVYGVVGVHNWQLALFDKRAQDEVWGQDTSVLISSSYAPVGKVTKVEGGFRLSGRWSFSSGCDHCDWVFLGAVVPEEGAPFDMQNYRTFLLPRSDYTIIDTWHVVGLKGTGSQDILVEDVFVPEYRTHKTIEDGFQCNNPGNAVNTAPLYRLPFGQVFVRAVCTGTLGAARGQLKAFCEVATGRTSSAGKMQQDVFAQNVAAEAAAEIRDMERTMYHNFDTMMALAREGKPISERDRVQYRYDSAIVADRCAEISAKMQKACGGRGVFLGHPVLERHLDIMASQAHVANNALMFGKNLGGVLFGLDNTDFNI